MLTRAYDAIMASLQVPMITNQNVDFNNTTIDDSVLNCKDYSGAVRNVFSPSYYNTKMDSTSVQAIYYPFALWRVNDNSTLFPDEEESTPDYEDYSVPNGNPSGWTVSSQHPSFSKSYDPGTKEIVCSVTVLWQNTSGASKTVYGVKTRILYPYRPSFDNTGIGSSNIGRFLTCREHFAAPVVVEDQGIISLTFTWRVGRAGLVSATAAAAE